MKLPARLAAWSPLLLLACALAYGAVLSLQDEPCPEERAGRAAGTFIAAAFALYFFAGYWLGVTRRYLALAVASLFAWHLLVLTPFLTNTCSEGKRLAALRQVTGFGLHECAIALVIIATASAIALVIRYRKLGSSSPLAVRRFLLLLAAGATAVTTVLWLGALVLVPSLRVAYQGLLAADLPMPTMLLLDYYGFLAAVPLVCLAGLIHVAMRRDSGGGHAGLSLKPAMALLVFINFYAVVLVFAALAPVKTMCRCI